MNRAQWKMPSHVGLLYLVASEIGLEKISWKPLDVPFAKSLKGDASEIRLLAQAVAELTEYFAGRRQTFTVPRDVQGTRFQEKVWEQLSKIPYGKTYSYSEIAKRIGNPKATRAVGTANGRNPISIMVPCHRVIAADGSLGGFGGGLANKITLLKLEQTNLALKR